MNIGRFEHRGEPVYGLVHGDMVWHAEGSVFDSPTKGEPLGSFNELKALVPCEPTKIIGVAVNYRRPEVEFSEGEPQIFMKPPNAAVGPGDAIVYPWMSQWVIYEPELAVVVGKTAKNVPHDRAADYVLGYTCSNDVTAKDLSQVDRLNVGRAKLFDTFCALGPIIRTDVDGNDLAIHLRLNGETVVSAHTSKMIHSVEEVVSFVSCITTLLPGDVILMSTPAIGALHVGDVVEVEIEGIGVLKNHVVESENSEVVWQSV